MEKATSYPDHSHGTQHTSVQLSYDQKALLGQLAPEKAAGIKKKNKKTKPIFSISLQGRMFL